MLTQDLVNELRAKFKKDATKLVDAIRYGELSYKDAETIYNANKLQLELDILKLTNGVLNDN